MRVGVARRPVEQVVELELVVLGRRAGRVTVELRAVARVDARSARVTRTRAPASQQPARSATSSQTIAVTRARPVAEDQPQELAAVAPRRRSASRTSST